MSITVTTASQHWRMVSPMQLKNALGGKRTSSAVMTAARRMAVPVPNGWNAQIASYALPLYSVIEIARCNPGHAIFCCPIANSLNEVQRITVADTTTHGNHPCQLGTDDVGRSPATTVLLIANSGSGAGRQTCRKSSVATSEPSEDSTSVSV